MSFPLPPLEMWGGLECTINRVGDDYFDQLERNGHINRPDDLHRFAELGIRALRYPIQWERIAPNGLAQANWQWADERLNMLRALGVSPIVGLTHHGSGPRHTSLIELSFAEGLAQFADAVAQRYPWIEYYTPVNEPLTTARFSGLYGLWHPHGHDYPTLVRILLIQCRAIVLAMQAIRQINPSAQLLQTEDMGKVFSTPLLADQANWENKRRWLTFDLLCGRIDRTYPLWDFLVSSGASEAELDWFLEHPCPPDILGVDYYPTSERFLDEHVDRYPVVFHTHNGRYKYADVEAIRVDTGSPLPLGYYERIQEAWARYRIPLAITEAHLGCTREEQLRWLMGAWNTAQALREEGVPVHAITAWSLLGAYDWNNLVTRITNFYEPGVFDVRGSYPRPTALAGLVRTLAAGKLPDHPILAQPGWWNRSDRFFYQSYLEAIPSIHSRQQAHELTRQERPLLIIEAENALAKAFIRHCNIRGLSYRLVTERNMDMSDTHAVNTILHKLSPWAVISLTGSDYTTNTTHSAAHGYNKPLREVTILADACAQRGVPLVAFSSDLVFDGTQQTPYMESDPVTPTCINGRIQAEMEEQILQHCSSALVIRTGPLFSPWENFYFGATLRWRKEHSQADANQTIVSPTYVPDMIDTCLDLLIDGEQGRWHLANSGSLSWTDFVQRIVNFKVMKPSNNNWKQVQTQTQIKDPASHAIISRTLHSERGQLLPLLDDALSRYQQESTKEQEQPVA